MKKEPARAPHNQIWSWNREKRSKREKKALNSFKALDLDPDFALENKL